MRKCGTGRRAAKNTAHRSGARRLRVAMRGKITRLCTADRTSRLLQTRCMHPVVLRQPALHLAAVKTGRDLLTRCFAEHMAVHAAIVVRDLLRLQKRFGVDLIFGRRLRARLGAALLAAGYENEANENKQRKTKQLFHRIPPFR